VGEVGIQNKLLERFCDFFLVEQRIRAKAYLISVGVTLAYSLVAMLLLHMSDTSVAIQATSLLCALVVIFVVRYVALGRPPDSDVRHEVKTFHFGWKGIVLSGATVLALIAVTMQFNIPPKLQALSVNFKLNLLTTQLDVVSAATISDSQLQDRFKTIQSTVNSLSSQVPVNPNDLLKTQTAILRVLKTHPSSEQTKEAGWGAAVDLNLLAARRLVGPRTESPPAGYHMNSPVTLKNANLTILGGPSTFYLGESVIVEQSTVIFDKVDFIGTGASDAIVVLGQGSHVLVQDSIVKNIRQRVDGIVWNDVRFENVSLDYVDGPIRMHNVTFRECDVFRLITSQATGELANRITAAEASGEPITYAYDP
jgi:hypothetical protein